MYHMWTDQSVFQFRQVVLRINNDTVKCITSHFGGTLCHRSSSSCAYYIYYIILLHIYNENTTSPSSKYHITLLKVPHRHNAHPIIFHPQVQVQTFLCSPSVGYVIYIYMVWLKSQSTLPRNASIKHLITYNLPQVTLSHNAHPIIFHPQVQVQTFLIHFRLGWHQQNTKKV